MPARFPGVHASSGWPRRASAVIVVGAAVGPLIAALALGMACLPQVSRAAEPQAATFTPAQLEFFEKQVRPLLVARCYECHAIEKPKGSLRLDSRAAALAGGDTGPAIVPHEPDKSLLVDAVRYGDQYQMPPKSQLPAEEIATLVEWVRLGAPWPQEAAPVAKSSAPTVGIRPFDLAERAKHWCFQPLAIVAPPLVMDTSWPRTPVDRFLLARLEAAGLSPAPPADKRTLLRRVTFDLIGLPPTPEEIVAFLADNSPQAFDAVVERLLASPHYGERWARHWLDLVRFAETHGHEHDTDMPNAWQYRDYAVRAFNADLPFDQFVTEHIAGDRVDPPRRHPRDGFNESIIGTGFFFLHESKHSPVDVRGDEADRIDNQIDVLAKTFLGLTVSCARCHDHKFDPISQRDYYALAGFLQSSRFQQAFLDDPQATAPALDELAQVRRDERAAVKNFARQQLRPRLENLAEALLATTIPSKPDDLLHAWATLGATKPDLSPEEFRKRREESAGRLREMDTAQAPAKSAATNAGQLPADRIVFADFRGREYADCSGSGWFVTGDAFGRGPAAPLDLIPPELCRHEKTQQPQPQVFEASAAHSGLLSSKLRGVLRSATFTIAKPKIWYRLYGSSGEVRLIVDGIQLIQDPIYGGLKFGPGGLTPHWHEQDVSKWIGHNAYIEIIDDGEGYLAVERIVFADGGLTSAQEATPAGPNPLIVRLLADPAIDSPTALARAYQRTFIAALDGWLASDESDTATEKSLSLPGRGQPEKSLSLLGRGQGEGPEASAEIVNWLLAQALSAKPPTEPSLLGPVDTTTLAARLAELDRRRTQIEAGLRPSRRAMALADGTGENERLFIRGSHKLLGDEVPRRMLEVIAGGNQPAIEQGSGRLELARRMTAASNPLLARVLVNRVWQHHFGRGIVPTPDDFGVMGRPPSHPELLDYLAAQFMREGWSIKTLHRQLVLSSAYRMSSAPQPTADAADPTNTLLHRANSRRLEAECIRDALLAVSGRLDRTPFGPGVPPHLTPFMSGRGRPTTSGPLDGGGRRSIYLTVRRNFLMPMLLAFDYPTPFTTIGRRSESNVPAQALVMMNSPLVWEQANVWAKQVLAAPERSAEMRIAGMYVRALGREPAREELEAALEFLRAQSAQYGDTDPTRAWTDLAHVLFNTKEFVYVQ